MESKAQKLENTHRRFAEAARRLLAESGHDVLEFRPIDAVQLLSIDPEEDCAAVAAAYLADYDEKPNRRAMEKAAAGFIVRHPELAGKRIRFDYIAAIHINDGTALVRHHIDALAEPNKK